MELKKLMTIFVVFLAVLAAMSTIIEAQRGGGHGGGHHWSVNAGSYNNNAGNNAGAIDVYVSTDKRVYVLGEPIEITVTAYNPTGYPVGVDYRGCDTFGYIIDGYIGPYDAVDKNGTIIGSMYCPTRGTLVFQPRQTITQTFTRYASTYGNYVPLPVGRHRVVGTVGSIPTNQPYDYDPIYKSRPITIRVVDPNNSGM